MRFASPLPAGRSFPYAHRVLERTVYPTVPPKVEYRAIPIAEDLHQHIAGLTQWAERHRSDVADARPAYDLAAKEPAES